MNKISLINDTISHDDIDALCEWLKTYPRLTQGQLVRDFEEKFAKWQGRQYAVMVNSGSSANLLMVWVLKELNKLRNNNVIVPSISWATSVAPFIQFGFNPIFCDADKNNLGIDTEKLEEYFQKYNPSMLLLVHVLGLPCNMDKIQYLCSKYGVIVLEDNCEGQGGVHNGTNTGNFGLMSSFSFYFGHMMSCGEGGMICTDDEELYNALLCCREHGWDRNSTKENQQTLRKKYNVTDFKSQYTFYYSGFNCRSMDINAFLGIRQLDKINNNITIRSKNFKTYQKLLHNSYWKPVVNEGDIISNFAYPVIHPKRDKIVADLTENGIETRPLIAGNMVRQPVIQKYFRENNNKGYEPTPFADIVDLAGLYLPNHPALTEAEIQTICNVVNKHTA